MIKALKSDAAAFWKEAAKDGPIEIWRINGQNYLANGNHRFFAAMEAGVDIPTEMIKIVEKTASDIPTFQLHNMTRVP